MDSMSQSTPKVHCWADNLSGALVLFLVVFAPWALGTSEGWSISTLNIGGYLLGGAARGKVDGAESHRV
jgi:hypothetical protein